MGLSDQYISIQGQLLLMNPMPTLNQAYSLLLQEETRGDSSTHLSTTFENITLSVKHFNAQQNFRTAKKSADKLMGVPLNCAYCHQDKHTRGQCFMSICTP